MTRPIAPLALLLLLLAAPASRAQPAEALRLYDEGTERLVDGNYGGAVGSYRTALDLGVASAAIYYNLGIAYYRLDALGESIRSFERARRLAPGDRRILHNLEIARSRLPERFSRLPVRFWTRAWQSVVTRIGATGLFAMGLALWLLPLAGMAWSLRTRRRPAWLSRAGWPAGVLAAILVGAALAASVRSPFGDQAVILDDVVPLFVSASGEETDVVLHEGLTVDIEDRSGGWLRIRLPNGVSGWIEARTAGEI